MITVATTNVNIRENMTNKTTNNMTNQQNYTKLVTQSYTRHQAAPTDNKSTTVRGEKLEKKSKKSGTTEFATGCYRRRPKN